MKLHYFCDYCSAEIDILEVNEVDEAKLGFDCLTAEERQDIIKLDASGQIMYVKALCDSCIAILGLPEALDDTGKLRSFTH